MQFEKESANLLPQLLSKLELGFGALPGIKPDLRSKEMLEVLTRVVERMHDNYPYHHPLYAGQMLKPPHAAARLAYMLSMWINPNNHALDGGKASSVMEREAVSGIAGMLGWQNHLGHLCSGGTMANLEALWIAGKIHPGKKIAASAQAHYTHQRITEVLKIPFIQVDCDQSARMDVNKLEDIIKNEQIGTVVVTMGTTGTGSVDPLPDILSLQEKYHFRIHADAAYGGYYILSDKIRKETGAAFDLLTQADSIVIDPHKHGLQPYGAGCVLFADPAVGTYYKHDSPYTYFTSDDLHLGEISLECSRPGASAVALWATMQLFPLEKNGIFAANLNKSRQAALNLYDKVLKDPRFLTLFAPELDILVWAPNSSSISSISELSRKIFTGCADRNLHLAVFNYPVDKLPESWDHIEKDQEYVTCLRSCLMKPEHLDWADEIWKIIDKVSDEIL